MPSSHCAVHVVTIVKYYLTDQSYTVLRLTLLIVIIRKQHIRRVV
jgi:hypothetical protein